MEPTFVLKENWLTQKPAAGATPVTLAILFFVLVSSLSFFTGFLGADQWMPASGESVFLKHEYWRAWTTLFAHGDVGHLLSNLFLFTPFAFLLTSYFGNFFFPVIGIFVGGLINLVVLKTMPESTILLGISGVVYWMGAAWLTLFLLIDRREKLRRRFAILLFASVVLFLPETYKPEISYMSHFLGYLFGVISALTLFFFQRKKYRTAEVYEIIFETSLENAEEPGLAEYVPQ
jgi:rhomboid protease GluP